MANGFWGKLQRPFFVLAPLANVTDQAFRRVIAKYGKPDVLWTEFVSADGLFLAREYQDADGNPTPNHPLLVDLAYTEAERPIIAQFFTSNPERMEKAARLAAKLGFDGIDINMGCPDRTIEKQGAGAALIKTPELAVALIEAAKRGAGELPVSVKTRIGYNRDEIETWIPKLLAAKPAALTLHARTRKEMSLVPARWEHVKRAVELRDQLSPETLIIGNGDALSIKDAREKAAASGADGVMLGRAIFGNPWLFAESNLKKDQGVGYGDISPQNEKHADISAYSPTVEEKLRVMVEHTKLFEELLGAHKNMAIMKKHYKAYVHGFDGAKELRMELMEAKDVAEIETKVSAFLHLQK
jgi:nifR3 family TIM-barrel protein